MSINSKKQRTLLAGVLTAYLIVVIVLGSRNDVPPAPCDGVCERVECSTAKYQPTTKESCYIRFMIIRVYKMGYIGK